MLYLLGQSGKAELFRNGEHFMDILDDREYNYESPIIHHFDPPLELLPGDSIKTICRFNTLDGTKRRDNIVKFGESTQVFYKLAIMINATTANNNNNNNNKNNNKNNHNNKNKNNNNGNKYNSNL